MRNVSRIGKVMRTKDNHLAFDLANAALAVAQTNLYLVGIVQVDGVGWNDWHDARQLLIDVERSTGAIPAVVISRAFDVLAEAAQRNGHTNL